MSARRLLVVGAGVLGLMVVAPVPVVLAACTAPGICLPIGQQPAPKPSDPAIPAAQAPLGTPGVDVGTGGLAVWIYGGGSWLPTRVDSALQVTWKSDWFLPSYGRMIDIAALLYLPFFLFGILSGLARRDVALMLKVAFWYLPIAIFVTVTAIGLTQALMAITDGFTGYVLQGAGGDLDKLLSDASNTLIRASAGAIFLGAESIVAVGVAGILLLALLAILLELLLREGAIYVALLFVPVTAVTLLWPRTQVLFKRLVEVLIGLILIKFVIASVLALGAVAFAANPFSMGALGDPGLATILTGAVVVFLAALAPFALIQVIPLVEVAALESFGGQARQWAATPVGFGTRHTIRAITSGGSGGGGSASGAPPLLLASGEGAAAAGTGALVLAMEGGRWTVRQAAQQAQVAQPPPAPEPPASPPTPAPPPDRPKLPPPAEGGPDGGTG